MRKTLLAALGLALVLTGCGAALQGAAEALPDGARDAALGALRAWTDSRWTLQDPIDEFFQAVDARDAQAVRALFSPNVQAEDADLDDSIQALFDLYPGPTEDCGMTSPAGSSQHLEYGRRTMVNVRAALPAVCGGVNYYCSFSYVTRDEADPGNVGIKRVVFATEAARCHPDYYQNALDLGDGLSVVTSPAAEGETRRIGDQPFAFTPIERSVAQADLLAFLEGEDSWAALTARFGPPNARDALGTGYYYELSPEDGQPRYVHIYTQDYGDGAPRVRSAYLYNDHDYREIATLWENPRGT